MGYESIDVVNYQREHDTRTIIRAASRQLPDLQARLNQTNVVPQDQSGHWNGSGYQTYFTLDESLLDSTDVLI